VQPATSPRVLVLGSASPRRRQILEQLGIEPIACPADVDESTRPGEAPGAYLERIVGAKLDAVRRLVPAAARARARVVLVADTSVVDGDRILGKPRDRHDARAMLASLAGRTHAVQTRFALGASAGEEVFHQETVVTAVTFRPLDAREIDAYAAGGEGDDKAGELIMALRRIEGP